MIPMRRGPNLLLDQISPSRTTPGPLTAKPVLSHNGLDHLVRLEGLRLEAYKDVAGYWTIGVGHLLTESELRTGFISIGGVDVEWRKGLTEEQAYQLLDQDADWAERAVNTMVKVELSQNQFDALVSFVFNVGPTNFRRSSLLRLLNTGDYRAVPGQMQRWTRAGGKVWTGLINRRHAESALWLA